MRLRGLCTASTIALALLAFSEQAGAEGRSCLVSAGLDNIAVSALGGCEWEVAKDFSMGVTGTFIHPIIPVFNPHLEADLTASVIINGRWVIGTAGGLGGHWFSPHIAGYANALLFFTGTMPVAPYIESSAHFFPHGLGKSNDDHVLFRQRLGVNVKMGKTGGSIAAGGQLVTLGLPNDPNAKSTGAFATFMYIF